MKDIIAKRRKELGYTQQELAEKLNISDKVVSKWETGRSLPDTSILIDLAEVLGISVNELLKSDIDSKETIKTTFDTEINVKYKNLFIIVMTMQLIAVILMAVGRIAIDKMQYLYGKAETICYVVMVLAVLFEIGAIALYLVMRNNLLNKYPTSTIIDRQYINRVLFCTYPLILAVVIIFVVYHGLEFYEQVISSLILGAIFLIPFAILYAWNKKRD